MSACRTIIHGWFRPFLYFAKPAFSEIVCGEIHSPPHDKKPVVICKSKRNFCKT